MSPRERNRQRVKQVYWNLRLFGLPEPLRDMWLLVITVLLALALSSQQSSIDRQREGRRVAIQVFCGVSQAVIDAGRAQILGSAAIGPPRFARNLERLGFPDPRARQRTAQMAAGAYSRGIARAVEREAGTHDLVNGDGRLLCNRLVGQAQAR